MTESVNDKTTRQVIIAKHSLCSWCSNAHTLLDTTPRSGNGTFGCYKNQQIEFPITSWRPCRRIVMRPIYPTTRGERYVRARSTQAALKPSYLRYDRGLRHLFSSLHITVYNEDPPNQAGDDDGLVDFFCHCYIKCILGLGGCYRLSSGFIPDQSKLTIKY